MSITITAKELAIQNEEKKKLVSELIIVNSKIALLNEEKERWTAELIIANKELSYQNKEKGKRAEELVIANKELADQNQKKETRAAELIIANKELAFQNKEKEKRAAELGVANIELAYQNVEKENRAAELIIANKELAFQNTEKETRAAELRIANNELAERTVELESLNKELESFSYSVSHDLKSPIRVINGYAKILEEDYAGKLDSGGTNALYAIRQNSKKMEVLIYDLLAFSKLGRKEITISQINMTNIVSSVKAELATDDSEHKIKFDVKALPSANGDESLIRQVWINLISNAIKYSGKTEETHIEIGASEKDGLFVYYVKDNGVGFDMLYYDSLFGVFQRLHSHEEFEGTGVGLAIVQKIVHRHSGTVWAESKVNEGACFYFSLPDNNITS